MRIAIIAVMALLLIAGTAVALKTYFGYQGRPVYGPGYAAGGCTGSCCATGPRAGQGSGNAAGTDLKAVEELAARYYSETYGEKDFSVEVKDFGCHQEAYILKEGKPVKRLSISGGNIYEIG